MKKIMALTLGILLIASNCFATLLTYTTISSDAGVSTSALNDRYSEIKTVVNGNIGSINLADQSIGSEDIAVSANPLKRDGENIGEYVYSGGTIATSATLASTITAMVAYIQNDADGYLHRVATAATNKTFTASKDTYVYCDYAGAFIYQEVALGAAQPSDPTNSSILAKVVTSGTAVTAVTDLRQTTPTNLRIYSYYKNGLVLSRDIATATTVLVGPGDIELGTAGKKRANSDWISLSFTTAGIGGLDTGSLAANTYYYIFACPSDTNATNYKVIASLSSTDAATVTNERLIGWCYAPTTGIISPDSVGAFRKYGGDAPNIVTRINTGIQTTTSGSYINASGMETKYVSSGRPVKIRFLGHIYGAVDSYGAWSVISVDSGACVGSDGGSVILAQGTNWAGNLISEWTGNIPEGTHDIKVQWKVNGGNAVNLMNRIITVEEL